MFPAGNEPTTIEEFYARVATLGIGMYAYNEGQVIHCNTESIKSVGDNAWDEEWENGGIDNTNGNLYDTTAHFRNKGYIRILPNTQYYFKKPIGIVTYLFFYDEDKNFVKWLDPFPTEGEGGVFTTPNAPYMRFVCYESTYNHNITISLYHSGWKADTDAKYQPYWEDRLMFDKRIKDEFPDGMSKWDAVYNKNGRGYIVHGLGVVDLEELAWDYYSSSNTSLFKAQFSNVLSQTGVAAGLLCKRYVTTNDLEWQNDKVILATSLSDGQLWIHDEYYVDDLDGFIESLAGLMLYYQLAEPTIIEYDEPFNLDYKVADFGTEEIIAPQPSAPISADIIYQFNAVDMIREHELEITELQRIIATMQAQLTSLTSNNGGQ
jgi:hypothetical protein